MIRFMPTLTELGQQQVNNCKFLLQRFYRIASATDSKGSQAISLTDIEKLFAPPSPEKNRTGDHSSNHIQQR